MLVSLLIIATAPAAQRIDRPIIADPVPLAVTTRGLVEDAPQLEYDVRELLMCDPDAERRPRLCYSIANLDRWQQREEDERRKEDQLMEEAIDQSGQEDSNIPWR